MERLTWEDYNGGCYAQDILQQDYDTATVFTGEPIDRLAAYERTEHTPEECAAAFEERDNYKILRADADRIRESMMQENLMLIGEKMRLEKELAAYREAEQELTVEDIAYAYLQICEKDCAGDCTTGIPPCRFYNPPDVGLFGEPLPFGCELEDYCEYRSDAALKEQEGQK